MNKFSVLMLVNRSDNRFEKAVESVIEQEPDEFCVYVDTRKVDVKDVKRVLKDANAVVSPQIFNSAYSQQHNLVHNLHRGILECNNEWVQRCDDDDELLGRNRRELIDEGFGIIHGDKLVDYGDRTKVQKSTQINDCNDLKHKRIFTGTAILNREAFQKVHPLINHGYFCDWQIFYWILRANYKAKYIPEVLYLQHANPNPSRERLKLYGTFPQVVDELNLVPDELLEYSKGIDSADWKYHFSFVE